MGIIEAIVKGFSLSKKLLKIVLIFFVLNAVMGLVSLPLANPENAGNPGVIAISVVLSIVFFAVFIFLQGGAIGLVRDIHKTGNCAMSNFSVYGKKYYLRILALLGIYILIALALVVVLSLVGSGVLALANNVFTRAVVGTVAALVAIITIVLLLFPIYSIVADETGTIQALKNGVKAGRENFWKILGLFFVLVIVSALISLIIGFVIGLVTVPLPFTVTQVIITIVNSAVQSYIPIVMMLALMGYYLGFSKQATGSQGSQSPPA